MREIYQCHSASHLHYWKGGGGGGGGGWIPAGVGRSRKWWDLIEAEANVLNKKLKFLHCAVKII